MGRYRYIGLYNLISWEDMIKIIQEAEGNSSKKREILEEMYDFYSDTFLRNKQAIQRKRIEEMTSNVDAKDYDKRLRIFKKRLEILLR